jgi:two-component system sensor histidine kinase PilS (NtrC family)
LEGIGEGLAVFDRQHRILYHNREAGKLLLREKNLEGHALEEVFGDSLAEEARKAMDDGQIRRLEMDHRRPDGSILPFLIRMIPIGEPEGETEGLIVVIDDITAEKKMEEFFKHRERIATLGRFSATIAHEFRNPLASIRGAVQEISRSVEIPANKKVLLEIVLAESDRMDHIITEFLHYARLPAPRLEGVHPLRLLEEVRMALLKDGEGVEVEVEAPASLLGLKADREQLLQALLHLGVNALHAISGRPQPRIHLKAWEATFRQAQGLEAVALDVRAGRRGVVFEVRDSGPGLSEEARRRVFEPFFTTKEQGTGLGLALVARIIQGHEGNITAESRPGEGTAFKIWIPSDLEISQKPGRAKAGAGQVA